MAKKSPTTDLQFRFSYISHLVEFGEKDTAALEQLAPHLQPLLLILTNALMDRHSKFSGSTQAQSEAQTTALESYLKGLLHGPYDYRFYSSLDWMLEASENNEALTYTHITDTLAHVDRLLQHHIGALSLASDTKASTLEALRKLLWIQNDYLANKVIKQSQKERPFRFPQDCPIMPFIVGVTLGWFAWRLGKR